MDFLAANLEFLISEMTEHYIMILSVKITFISLKQSLTFKKRYFYHLSFTALIICRKTTCTNISSILNLTRPVLDRFHDSSRQSWAMCKIIVIAYNPSAAKPILWVKFISAFWRQKQSFSAHTIGQILFVRILEVTFGKTQFSFLTTFFIRF